MGRAFVAARVPWTWLVCLSAGVPGAPVLAQVAPPTAFWELTVHGQEFWYSNPYFTNVHQSVLGTRAGAGLAYTRNSSVSQFGAAADIAYSFDDKQQGNNRINYTGTLNWTRQLGPRTGVRVSEALSQTYDQSTPLLALTGLVYPYTSIRTSSSLVALTQKLSTRTSLSLSGRYYRVDFPDSTLYSGQQATGTVEVGQTVGTLDRLAVSYEYRWDHTQGPVPTYQTSSGVASWSHRLGAATSGTMSVGASYWTLPSQAAYQLMLDAGASLTGRIERTTYTLAYSHTPQQAYGFGRPRLVDTVSLNLNRPVSRTLTATAGGIRTWSRDLIVSTNEYDSQALSVTLRYRPQAKLNFGAGYAWTRIVLNGVVQGSHSLDVSASYGWRWQ